MSTSVVSTIIIHWRK